MRELFERLYRGNRKQFHEYVYNAFIENQKLLIITANPETFVLAEKNPQFKQILMKDTTVIVPDGIGIIKAARSLGIPLEERITGVDLTVDLFRFASEQKKSLFLYGAKPEVILLLTKKLSCEYPGAAVVGAYHGYGQNNSELEEEIIEKKPDILITALGMPKQEVFLDHCADKLEKGIFIGVGGSFDIISGTKKRAPDIFVKYNLEWLYRIAKEPRRLGRFYRSNIKFIFTYKK